MGPNTGRLSGKSASGIGWRKRGSVGLQEGDCGRRVAAKRNNSGHSSRSPDRDGVPESKAPHADGEAHFGPSVRGDYRTETGFESRAESQVGRGKSRFGDAQRDGAEQIVETTIFWGSNILRPL